MPGEKGFKVEIRTTCLICGKPLDAKKRQRTFCCKKCRQRSYTIKSREYSLEWQRKRRGQYKEGRLQCPICGMWYEALGSHLAWGHGITAAEFKDEYHLKKNVGLISDRFYQNRRSKAVDEDGKLRPNVAHNLLVRGKKTRIKPGEKKGRTKGVSDRITYNDLAKQLGLDY